MLPGRSLCVSRGRTLGPATGARRHHLFSATRFCRGGSRCVKATGTASPGEGDDDVLDAYLDYRLLEFRVGGEDFDPAASFTPPRAYEALEFTLEDVSDDEDDFDDMDDETSKLPPVRDVERGWLRQKEIVRNADDFMWLEFCLNQIKIPITHIIRDHGLRLRRAPLGILGSHSYDALDSLESFGFEDLWTAAGALDASIGPMRYLEAVAEGDIDASEMWSSVRAWFPESGDVFAVTFEHEGMLGLHCLKAVEEGRDMIRDIIPVFADEADALRFADNVQPYMPFRASVKRIDAFAAVALATDLNAHLHLEREGSLLIPPQTAVLLTDLERAAALAKDRYSVLEGAPWDAHRGLAAPTEIEAFGDGGRVGVVEGELSAIVEDDGIKLSLPALRMRGEAGRGGEGEEGEGGESGDDWENEESEDDLDGDSEVIFFGEEGFGDEGDYDDVEIGDRDIFVLHYESGAVRVWGEPSRRGSAGEDAPGTSGRGVVPTTSVLSLMPVVSDTPSGSRGRQSQGQRSVSLQELLRKGPAASETLRPRIEDRLRSLVERREGLPRLYAKPEWPPRRGRGRWMWEEERGVGGEDGEDKGGRGEEEEMAKLARERQEELLTSGDNAFLRGVLITSDGSRMDVRGTDDASGSDRDLGPAISWGGGLASCVVAQGIVYAGPVDCWDGSGDEEAELY